MVSLALKQNLIFSHSVSRSVGPSVGPSVTLLKFLPKIFLNRINAPAHPYATDAVVYTTLFLFRNDLFYLDLNIARLHYTQTLVIENS